MFPDIESTEDTVLEPDPNLERSMTVHGIEEMLAFYHKLYQKKVASSVQTALDKFPINKRTFSVFSVLNSSILNKY